jgi:small-conductance mechanosensitive channel
MKSILNLFRPTQAEVAIQEDISRGREKPKQSTTPATSRSSHRHTITPSTVGGSELDQLRASLADMDARLQLAIAERDSLKLEFNDYRQAANADASDLEKLNRDLKTQLRETGQQLSLHIASQAQLGPLPDMAEDSSPEGRTDRHYMRLARQLKSGSTGEPTTQRLERP